MDDFFASINRIIKKLREIMVSNKPISEDLFFPLVGDYSKCLNALLALYHESSRPQEEKECMSPYLNYYRQLQNYLIFICRFPTILLVPNHSEILQTLNFIDQKEKLLKDLYEHFSQDEKKLLTGRFKKDLETLLKKGK
jgi:hypothetical protein